MPPQQKAKISVTLYVMTAITVLLIILTALFLRFPINGGTRSDRSISILGGPWKFKTGDNIQWRQPNFDDLQWEITDLKATPDSHDGDVGLSGYVPGWTSKGYPNYAGFAWYRIEISLESLKNENLALLAPPAVDDAYQLFVNGSLLGSSGDFSVSPPTAFSIQPRIFLLPKNISQSKNIVIAFRVWMSSGTLSQAPDVGGIHIAPRIGGKSSIESVYKSQWEQTIKGYIVEVIEPLIFILLAISMAILSRARKQTPSYKWFIAGLVLLALYRANQAVYFWLQIESAHLYDLLSIVILRPLILGCWLMAWWKWYKLCQPTWIPKCIVLFTSIYIVVQLLALFWLSGAIRGGHFQRIADYTRLLFVALMVFIMFKGFICQQRKEWLVPLAALLLAIGLFAQEVSTLHIIPGIYFPYGVGVSLTQYVYAAFILLMYVILIRQYKKNSNDL